MRNPLRKLLPHGGKDAQPEPNSASHLPVAELIHFLEGEVAIIDEELHERPWNVWVETPKTPIWLALNLRTLKPFNVTATDAEAPDTLGRERGRMQERMLKLRDRFLALTRIGAPANIIGIVRDQAGGVLPGSYRGVDPNFIQKKRAEGAKNAYGVFERACKKQPMSKLPELLNDLTQKLKELP